VVNQVVQEEVLLTIIQLVLVTHQVLLQVREIMVELHLYLELDMVLVVVVVLAQSEETAQAQMAVRAVLEQRQA
jgi:hypothetical protein